MKKVIGLYIDMDEIKEVDLYLEKANCKTRNEFLAKAVRFYLTHLNAQSRSELLTPAFESVVAGAIKDSEKKIVRLVYKLAVEMAMMMNVINYHYRNDIEKINLTELRKICSELVSETNGRFNFEDVYKFYQT